jgi:hypothetical protein
MLFTFDSDRPNRSANAVWVTLPFARGLRIRTGHPGLNSTGYFTG